MLTLLRYMFYHAAMDTLYASYLYARLLPPADVLHIRHQMYAMSSHVSLPRPRRQRNAPILKASASVGYEIHYGWHIR